MKKRDARIYIVEPVEVYNQREGRRLRGRTRQTMTDASRKKATVLISRRKKSPVFHLCAVGSGYAFAITPSGSTCGLWVRWPVEASSPSRQLILLRSRERGKMKKKRASEKCPFLSSPRSFSFFPSYFLIISL